jgi:hypothetical protein
MLFSVSFILGFIATSLETVKNSMAEMQAAKGRGRHVGRPRKLTPYNSTMLVGAKLVRLDIEFEKQSVLMDRS